MTFGSVSQKSFLVMSDCFYGCPMTEESRVMCEILDNLKHMVTSNGCSHFFIYL